jgi:hypothetical protein
MPFRPTIIFQDITQLVDTSAHAVIGARANLLSYMTEKLGIGAAHAEALIVGIETPP